MLDEAGMWPVHQKKFLKTVPHSLKKKKKTKRAREKCKHRNQHSTQKRGDHPSEAHCIPGPNEKSGMCPRDRRIHVLGVRSESLK